MTAVDISPNAHPFLSHDWLAFVKQHNDQHPALPLAPALQNAIINLHITGIDDTQNATLHLKNGQLQPDWHDAATSTLTIDYASAKQLLSQKDPKAVMQAFLTGQLHMTGDMSLLMTLATLQPAQELKSFYKTLWQHTLF